MQIKVLLIAVRDFKPETGDPAYTMGIVDLLLECIELSYRPGQLLSLFPTWTLITIMYKKVHSALNLTVLSWLLQRLVISD